MLIRSFPYLSRIAAIAVCLGATTLACAAPPITTGLFVNLNADSASNFVLGGDNLNNVSVWIDQANDGGDGTLQNFGNTQLINQPVFTTIVMPNGMTMNVVDFTRDDTPEVPITGAQSSTLESDFLISQAGGLTGDFTPGADPAYELGGTPDPDGLSYFVVWKTDITTNPEPDSDGGGNDARQGRQIVFQSFTSGPDVNYFGTVMTADTLTTIEFGEKTVPNQWHYIRNELGSQNFTPETDVTANWYISALTTNLDGGSTMLRTLQSDGTDTGTLTVGATNFSVPFQTHLHTLLGQNANAPGTSQWALDGQIAELLIYNAAFDEEDFDSIIAYLNDKYFVGGPSIPGDYDGNTEVDLADYATWRQAFGTANPSVDGNGNGIVDAADYVIWRDNLGAGVPLEGGSAAIPEPASVMLIAIGLVLLTARRFTQRT